MIPFFIYTVQKLHYVITFMSILPEISFYENYMQLGDEQLTNLVF